MVMVTGAAARCWKNAFHAFGSANFFLGGEDPDTPHGLHNFGARWVRLRPTWYRLPPKPKILATPLDLCVVFDASDT